MDINGHKRTDLPVHMGEDLGEVFFSRHIAPSSAGFFIFFDAVTLQLELWQNF